MINYSGERKFYDVPNRETGPNQDPERIVTYYLYTPQTDMFSIAVQIRALTLQNSPREKILDLEKPDRLEE